MQINYYYWSWQCPHNLIARDTVERLRKEGHKVEVFDVAENREQASSINMFSPTLTIIDGKWRWHGPLFDTFLEAVSRGEIPRQDPYLVKMSDRVTRGSLIPLTVDTIADTGEVCGVPSARPCSHKARWMQEIMEKYRLPHLGYLHYQNGKCVGGAEFVPSLEVPYRIPRDEKAAFLTCSFPSDGEVDFKSFPLERLEKQLPSLGFQFLLAISSEEVVFPNGPLEWFLVRGYRDTGVIHEESGYARMHLLMKKL